jgi:hypothetical protein
MGKQSTKTLTNSSGTSTVGLSTDGHAFHCLSRRGFIVRELVEWLKHLPRRGFICRSVTHLNLVFLEGILWFLKHEN